MIIGPFYDAATCQSCLSKIGWLWPNREKIGTAEDPVAAVRKMWAEEESSPPEIPASESSFEWNIKPKEMAEKFRDRPLGLERLPVSFQFSAHLNETRGKLPAKNQFRALLEALQRGDLSSHGVNTWMSLLPDPVRSSEGFKNPEVARFKLSGAGFEAAQIVIYADPEAPLSVRELIIELAPEMAATCGRISCSLPLSDWNAVLAAFSVFEKVARTHNPGAPMGMSFETPFDLPPADKIRFSDDEANALVKSIEAIVAFAMQPIAGTWAYSLWGYSEYLLLGTAWDRRGTVFEAHPTFCQMQQSMEGYPHKPILALRYTGSAYVIEFYGIKNDPALKPIEPLLKELIKMVK